MGPSEWGQANQALILALELSPRDRTLGGKHVTAEGHVERFQGQAGRGSASILRSEAAPAELREAAPVEPESVTVSASLPEQEIGPLVYQLEPVKLLRERPQDQRDMVLYLPDTLVIVDHQLRQAFRLDYEFSAGGQTTEGLPREGERIVLPRAEKNFERHADRKLQTAVEGEKLQTKLLQIGREAASALEEQGAEGGAGDNP